MPAASKASKQYVAVYTGEGLLAGRLIGLANLSPARSHNAVYAFALPNSD